MTEEDSASDSKVRVSMEGEEVQEAGAWSEQGKSSELDFFLPPLNH